MTVRFLLLLKWIKSDPPLLSTTGWYLRASGNSFPEWIWPIFMIKRYGLTWQLLLEFIWLLGLPAYEWNTWKKKNLVVKENSRILINIFVCISSFLKLNKANSSKHDDKKGNKGSSKSETATESGKTAVVFSLKNEVGGLVKALKLFQVNVKYYCVTLKVTVCMITNLSSVLKHCWINF